MLEKFSLTALLGLLKHQFSIIDPLELETLIRNKNFFGNNVFDIGQEDELFKKIQQTTRELKEFGNFKDLSNQHIKFVEEFANQDIWQGEVGKELQAFIEQLSSALENTAPISLKEYSLLFNHFLKSTYYREESLAKRITLLKPIDARLHSADIVILAGMNQDTWPTKTRPDPYFNPHLLDKIGFPLSSQAVGEEIYDFQCLAQAKEVIITRPEKINGTITIASPLVLRLQILSRNSINATYKLPMLEVLKLMKDKEPPLTSINYRPIQLSVTQIEKLIFNPYHIYVDLILKLKKLPLLIKELSALDFGNFIHRSLAIYHNNRNDTLINAGQRALKELKLNQPSIKMLWWPRFLRIAHWFITHENTEAKIFLEDFGKIKIGDNFTMIAIADRLEFLANSSINIIDYKTGRLSSAKSITTGKTLQLLLEAIIAQNGGFSCQVRNSSINALEYIQLSGGENPATILSIDLDSKIIEQTKAYLEELIKQYQDPKTPYYYTKKKTLNYCEYEHLSR
jgi:ATP-dependent helicase/nuclease subunit B